MGASVPSTVQDDDLDRHVADLILKEAKRKAENYAKNGFKAYISNALCVRVYLLMLAGLNVWGS